MEACHSTETWHSPVTLQSAWIGSATFRRLYSGKLTLVYRINHTESRVSMLYLNVNGNYDCKLQMADCKDVIPKNGVIHGLIS